MVPPFYISGGDDESMLCESMEAMLETVSRNVDADYLINMDLVTQYVQDGMTMRTFNLLVQNLNKDLGAQFNKKGGSYSAVMNYNSPIIH